MTQLDRIEAKLDQLIAALADDGEQPATDLDGNPMPPDRDEHQEL